MSTPYLVTVDDEIPFEVPQESDEFKHILKIREVLQLEDLISIKTILGDAFTEKELNKIMNKPTTVPVTKVECLICHNMVWKSEQYNCKSLGGWCHHGNHGAFYLSM